MPKWDGIREHSNIKKYGTESTSFSAKNEAGISFRA
jgi:hypothetical protein